MVLEIARLREPCSREPRWSKNCARLPRPGLRDQAGPAWDAAELLLLTHIVGRTGHVTSIDIDPRLASRARAALRAAGFAAKVVVGDGRSGYEKAAPYDRIIVTASATEMPRARLDQLVEGGRIVLPLRLDPDADAIQAIPVLERQAANCARST